MHAPVPRLCARPCAQIAEITFNFWYILSEEVAGGGRQLSDEQRAAARQLLEPMYVSLLPNPSTFLPAAAAAALLCIYTRNGCPVYGRYVSLLEALRGLAELPAEYVT